MSDGDATVENSSEKSLLLDGNYSINSNVSGHSFSSRKIHSWLSCRYILMYLSFFVYFNAYTMRINLSVSIVAMVNGSLTTKNVSETECPVLNHTPTVNTDGEFQWPESLKERVLGSFFYGYICTQFIGGYLAQRLGGKWIVGGALFANAVLTLLTPILTRKSVYLLITVRVLEGMLQGVIFPSMYALWAKWAPKYERSKLISHSFSGAQMGTVICLLLSGVLSSSTFLGGWPSVFYIFGAVTIIWFILWIFFIYDSPSKHPTISLDERRYIEESIGPISSTGRIPWTSILKSKPVWAIIVTSFCGTWGYYMMITNLPNFMGTILHFNLKQNGYLSAVPYLLFFILLTFCGYLADYIRSNNYLSTKNTRKLLVSIGFLLSAILTVTIGYTGCNVPLTTTVLILAVSTVAIAMPGYMVNHVDIAPKYAATIMGMSNTFATIPGFLVPEIVGLLTQDHQTRTRWEIVFYINLGVNIFGTIFFCLFGDGEEQPWARNHEDKKNTPS